MSIKVYIGLPQVKAFMVKVLLPLVIALNIIFLIIWFNSINLFLSSFYQNLNVFGAIKLGGSLIVFGVSWTLGIFIHEIIHGLTFAIFCKDGLKSIHFGRDKESGIYYTECKEPLSKTGFIIGSLMPFLVLGITPLVLAFYFGSLGTVLFASIFIYGSSADLLGVYYAFLVKGDYLFWEGEGDQKKLDFGFELIERPS